MEKANIPKIRFDKFNDDWEQRKLGEYVSITSGEAPSKFEVGTELYVKVDDLNYNDKYVVDTQNKVAEHSTVKRVTKGSVVFPKRGAAIMTNKVRIMGIDSYMDTNMMALTSEKLDSEFLYNIISKEGLYKIADTSTIPQINNKHVEPYEVTIPSFDEQAKIGEYFSNLDNLITLHQRKYEKLQMIKKSMLEKMFPQNGEKKPEIRFEGFTDDWEQRKLLSCIQSITDFRGRTPKKLGMDWSESGYLALSALNVKDGYIDFSQDVHYGNQELYDKWMSGKELHRGQVLFTTEAPMGNVAQVPDNKGYILSQRTIAFDVEEEILSENFLATLLRTPNVFNDLTALSSGGTAKGVSQKSLSGLDVVIPKNIDEQNKLADYFINLDHLITLHQRKLEKLRNIKKSMLEKMFV